MTEPHRRILVAVDTADADSARGLVRRLRGAVGGFKIGLELFVSAGPDLLREIRDGGDEVFLDLKFHDIPNTVAGAAAAAGGLGAHWFTMHALGGAEMLRRGAEAAREAAERAGLPAPVALAVTVLTSHDDADLAALGLAGPCGAAVARLADLAREAGCGGAVCSPLEVAAVRARFPGGRLVVPGIRPAGAAGSAGSPVAGDDQARTATPAGAVAAGADRLVIGRPIVRAADPAAAAAAIAAELAGASRA